MGIPGVQQLAYDRYGFERCSVVAIDAFVWNFTLKYFPAFSEWQFPGHLFSSTLSVADVDFPVNSSNQLCISLYQENEHPLGFPGADQ